MWEVSDFYLERCDMAIQILDNRNPCRFMVFVLVSFGFASTTFVGPVFADRPDRCFHTHYNNTTKCKPGIRGKKCTNAKGNKGRCQQISSKCYCKIYKNQGSGRELLDLGISIGGAFLEDKLNREHRSEDRRRDRERDRDEHWRK